MGKHTLGSLLSIAPVALIAATAIAAAPPAEPNAKPAMPDKSAKDMAKDRHEKLIKELKLTDKQEGPVRELLTAYRNDLAAWMHKNGPEIKRLQTLAGVRGVKDPKMAKVVKDASARMAALQAEQKKLLSDLLATLGEHLDKDQMSQARRALDPRYRAYGATNRFHMLRDLGLTAEQWKRIRSIISQIQSPPAGSKSAKSRDDLMLEAWQRVVKEVLTDDDLKKLDQVQAASHRSMVLGFLSRVKLTKEQAAKVDEIWNAAYQQGAEDPQKRHEQYFEARRKILRDVLTEDQRKQLTARPTKPAPGRMPPR